MEKFQHLRPKHQDQLVVLIAEDEPIICNIVRIALEAAGFFLLTAHDGLEAIELSRKFPGTIHALVSDIDMPRLGGLELREQILSERPDIKVLLMSGQIVSAPVEEIAFLPKPFRIHELKARLWELVSDAVGA